MMLARSRVIRQGRVGSCQARSTVSHFVFLVDSFLARVPSIRVVERGGLIRQRLRQPVEPLQYIDSSFNLSKGCGMLIREGVG